MAIPSLFFTYSYCRLNRYALLSFRSRDEGFIYSIKDTDTHCRIFVKISKNGVEEWSRVYSFGDCWVNDITFAPDSTMFVAMGWEGSYGLIFPMLLHLDTNGDTLRWGFHDATTERRSVICHYNGDSLIYVFGSMMPMYWMYHNFWAAIYDTAFNFIEEKNYEFGYRSLCYMNSVFHSETKVVIPCLFYENIGLIFFDIEMFDTTSTVEWLKPDTRDICNELARHPNGDIIVVGASRNYPSGTKPRLCPSGGFFGQPCAFVDR